MDAHCLSSAPDKPTLPDTAQNCIHWNDGDVAIAFALSMRNCLLANPNNVRTEPQSEIGRNKKRAEMILIQRSASLVGGLRCNVSRLLHMYWSRNEFRTGSLKRNTGKEWVPQEFLSWVWAQSAAAADLSLLSGKQEHIPTAKQTEQPNSKNQ